MISTSDELPREVSRGTVNFGSVSVEVVHLDNGQRIITAESMERIFAALEAGLIDASDMGESTPHNIQEGER